MNGFRRLVLIVSTALLVTVVAGCASVSSPKQPPADPVAFYLTDYGIHSSLILPVDDDGLYVEYAFGDYGYAALNRDGIFDAIGALLWSFKSGFGKQYLRAAPGADVPTLVYFPNKMKRLTASREAVRTVLNDLDDRFNANPGSVVHNELTKIDWKQDRQHYGLFNNCNQLTARQLETLGYDVHGPVMHSSFNVKGGEFVDPMAIKDPSKSPGGMSGSR